MNDLNDLLFDFDAFRDELEIIVDKNNIDVVLEALEDICYLKAEHLRTNWQDEITAQGWEELGSKLSNAIKYAQRNVWCTPDK